MEEKMKILEKYWPFGAGVFLLTIILTILCLMIKKTNKNSWNKVGLFLEQIFLITTEMVKKINLGGKIMLFFEKMNGPLRFIKKITPISLMLTLFVALTVSGIIPEILGLDLPAFFSLKNFVREQVSRLPFSNETIIFATEYSARGLLASVWFVFSLVEVKQRHLMVLRVFKERIPFSSLYLGEGLKGSVIPWPIVDGVQTTIVEITLGKEEIDGKTAYKTIACQTQDEQEVIIEYACQIRTFDPFLWENVDSPGEAIENRLLSQLRIIAGLFPEKTINPLKGVIAGMVLGKEYLIWRDSKGNLLYNSGGNILAVSAEEKDLKETLKTPSDKITKECLEGYLNKESEYRSDSGVVYYVEQIPTSTFDLQAVQKEARRVGAEMEAPSIRDVTPPQKVRDAAEENRIEELQGNAREVENIRHSKIALKTLGLPEDTKVHELDDKTFRRWKVLKDDPMIQEGKITKIKVDSSEDKPKTDLDKLATHVVAAAAMKK